MLQIVPVDKELKICRKGKSNREALKISIVLFL